MGKLLTISIAAYNAAKTIGECLDSFLLCRSLKDLEILVINDGSHDQTMDIVKAYEKKYPESIHLINKDNGGHGSTLNTSLKLATGKYYRAVDGDDWVVAQELDKLCDYLRKTDVDLVVDDYREVYPDHQRLISLRNGYEVGKIYQFNELFTNRNFNNQLFVMSNSTIKTKRLREVGMQIQEHCFYADTELYFYIGLATRTIIFADCCTYLYRLGSEGQSVSAAGYYKHIQDLIRIETNLMRLYTKVDPYIDSEVRRKYLFSIIDTRYNMLFDCYTKIIYKDDKDNLFIEFLHDTQEKYPQLIGAMHLSKINYFIAKNPKERIPGMRRFRTTFIFKCLYKLKHMKGNK